MALRRLSHHQRRPPALNRHPRMPVAHGLRNKPMDRQLCDFCRLASPESLVRAVYCPLTCQAHTALASAALACYRVGCGRLILIEAPSERQSHVPRMGRELADRAQRDGVAERFPTPAVQTSMAVATVRGHDVSTAPHPPRDRGTGGSRPACQREPAGTASSRRASGPARGSDRLIFERDPHHFLHRGNSLLQFGEGAHPQRPHPLLDSRLLEFQRAGPAEHEPA